MHHKNRVFIIAGELSGDIHAGGLIRSILHRSPALNILAWGGDNMELAGAKINKHIRDLAFMGIWEVIKNLPEIVRNFQQCKKEISEFKPDVLICVDYPGFNLRMGKWAKKKGIFTIYYIPPKVWAWNASRSKILRKYFNITLCTSPFEFNFLQKQGVNAIYVGNPVMDQIKKLRIDPITSIQKIKTNRPIIALLPGSRKQEIKRILPVMLAASKGFSDAIIAISTVAHIPIKIYRDIVSLVGLDTARVIFQEDPYRLLKKSKLALITSGTATLEAALLKVPQVVCYKTSTLMYQLARLLLTIPYISLVNLIADKKIVYEAIQKDCNKDTLQREMRNLFNIQIRKKIRKEYLEIEAYLGDGKANENAAKIVLNSLTSNT